MDRVDRAAVEGGRGLGRRVVDATDHLRHASRCVVGATGVDALRRVGEEEVPAGDEPALRFEDREQLVAGRARVRRRLEHDEVTRSEPPADLPRGAQDDREIGLALPGERGRECDQDRVGVAEDVVVGRRGERAVADEPCEHVARDVLDVALAGVDLRNTFGDDVDEHDRASGLGEHLRERQPDVPGADDADVVRRALGVGGRRGGLGGGHARVNGTAASGSL